MRSQDKIDLFILDTTLDVLEEACQLIDGLNPRLAVRSVGNIVRLFGDVHRIFFTK